ncbi:MAG: GerAB/ArcD/ProY family transporter [Clostridia bacterium]|nr:GerAB/ArcD/ProY family transporter [Clostridia bacterium]
MSSRQTFFLMAITLPVYKLAMLPSYLYSVAGRDMWLTCLCMILLDVAVLCMIYIIKSRIGVLNFTNKYLNFGAKGLALVFCIYFLFQISLLSCETVEYLQGYFFDENNRIQMIIPIVLCSVYLAYKGEKTLGRCAEVFIWGLVLTVGISIIFNSAKPDPDNLFPILDENGGEKLLSGYNVFLWFGDFLPLLFIDVKDRKKKGSTLVLLGSLGIGICTVLLFAVFTMQWGEMTENVPNAFVRLAGYNFISADVGKADWIAILHWLGSCVIKISFTLLGAVNAFSYVFGDKPRKIVSVCFGLVIFSLLTFVIKDVQIEFSFGVDVRFLGFILSLVLPFVLCVASVFSQKTVSDDIVEENVERVTDEDYMDKKGDTYAQIADQ